MASKYIPSLTVDGFISHGNVVMGKLFEYFLSSDYSQSNVFLGSIKSLKYILSMNNEPLNIAREIRDNLTELYSKYFEKVNCTCDVYIETKGKYHIAIEIKGYRDDRQYVLTRDLKASNGDIENFEEELDKLYKYYGEC